jgi:hypothetical protein
MSPTHDNTAIRSMKPENIAAKNGKSENGTASKPKPEAANANGSKELKPENGIAERQPEKAEVVAA